MTQPPQNQPESSGADDEPAKDGSGGSAEEPRREQSQDPWSRPPAEPGRQESPPYPQ